MKRLLMIEDDADLAAIVEMALYNRFILQIKKDGHNLIEVLDNFKPDVLLIDNHLGQKTAKEIIAEIRLCDGYAAIPFILFSAHSKVEEIARELMANAWLHKPFKLADLYTTIETVLHATAKNVTVN